MMAYLRSCLGGIRFWGYHYVYIYMPWGFHLLDLMTFVITVF